MPVEIRFAWGKPILRVIRLLRCFWVPLMRTPVRRRGKLARSSLRSLPWQGLTLLGLASGSGLFLPILMPLPAHAYMARMEITLDRQPGESYDTLLRRAEAAARAAAQRGFDRDVLVSELSIIVMAQNQGLTAPILALQVSRMQWRHRPDSSLWITYFRTARELLGLSSSPTAAPSVGAGGPPPPPTTAPTSPIPSPPTTPTPAATPTLPPAATPVPEGTPPAAETEASPTPSNQPGPRPLVIPAGSGVPRIPTLPSP